MAPSSGEALDPWETDDAEPWLAEDDVEHSGSESEFDYESVTRTEAAEELFMHLVELKVQGKITATQACVLAFWCSRAGAEGDVNRLAFAPGKSSGNYSKHFDLVVGAHDAAEDNFYYLDVPCSSRADCCRTVRKLPAIPPHEAIAEELQNQPELHAKLGLAIADRALPPAYFQNVVVAEAGPAASVFPLGLYMDGVPLTRHDGLLGFWIYNILSGSRKLVAVLRKSEHCNCGCRGWDSIFQVLLFLRWSLTCMKAGVHPGRRHDGAAFDEEDRLSLAGAPLGFHAALIFIKGDLAEYAATMGFPSVMSHANPCFGCTATIATRANLRGLSALGMAGCKTLEGYIAACEACTIRVTVNSIMVAFEPVSVFVLICVAWVAHNVLALASPRVEKLTFCGKIDVLVLRPASIEFTGR